MTAVVEDFICFSTEVSNGLFGIRADELIHRGKTIEEWASRETS